MSKILCNNYANFASNKDFNVMKKSKKAILDILSVESKGKDKGNRFESLVLNLALQKIDSDDFEFDGEAVYTVGKERRTRQTLWGGRTDANLKTVAKRYIIAPKLVPFL